MDISKIPCPICGSVDYKIGTARENGSYLHFTETHEMVSTFLREKLGIKIKTQIRTARHCQGCGHVALFLDPSEKS